jgi:uncharacterized surface protein with fasciclin (FAS1) repeats
LVKIFIFKISTLEEIFMSSFLRWSLAQTTLLVLGITAVTVNPIAVSAQTTTPSTTLSQSTTRNNIVAIAASNKSLTTLTTLLKAAGLTDTLQQPGPYTVFAPTDQAFAALPAGTVEQLQKPENKQLLIQILRYHVVPGALTANQLTTGELKTAENSPVNIRVDRTNNQVTVNDARVTQPNIRASNGVIHIINQVLIPPNLNTSQQPSTDSNQTTTTETTTSTDTSQTPTTETTTSTDTSQTPTTGTTGTETSQAPTVDTEVTPGRTTRGGSSYIGVAGNIGLGGDSALSEGNVAVITKVGLTNYISARPSAVFGDDTVVLLPLTLDFLPRSVNPTGEQRFPVSPFVGAGIAIETSDDADVGFMLTGGVDIPLGERLTLNGTANAAFLDDTDFGLLFGVGYNF